VFDSAHRRTAAGRKVISEHLRDLHLQRIGVRRPAGQPGYGRHVRRYLSTTDDHHQQLIRPDQRRDATAATAAIPDHSSEVCSAVVTVKARLTAGSLPVSPGSEA